MNRRNFLKAVAAAPAVAVAPQALERLAGMSVGGAGFAMPTESPAEWGNAVREVAGLSPRIPYSKALLDKWDAAIALFRRHQAIRSQWERAYRSYREQRWAKPEPRDRDAKFIARRWGQDKLIGKGQRGRDIPWYEDTKARFEKLPAWAKDDGLIAQFRERYFAKECAGNVPTSYIPTTGSR